MLISNISQRFLSFLSRYLYISRNTELTVVKTLHRSNRGKRIAQSAHYEIHLFTNFLDALEFVDRSGFMFQIQQEFGQYYITVWYNVPYIPTNALGRAMNNA